jgi:hypothetical protein
LGFGLILSGSGKALIGEKQQAQQANSSDSVYSVFGSDHGLPAYSGGGSQVVGTGATKFSASRVVQVPAPQRRPPKKSPGHMKLGLYQQSPAGGIF